MQRIRSWLSSLHFLLIMGFALVLTGSLVGVSLYVRYATEREIERFDREVEQVRAHRIEEIVVSYHEANEGLSGIGLVLDQATWLYDRNIEVSVPAEGGNVVYPATLTTPAQAESQPSGPSVASTQSSPTYAATIQAQGRDVAAIAIAQEPAGLPGNVPEPPLSRVLDTLDASLLWTGLAAGVSGIVLVSLLARRALSSIGTLRAAAGTLGRGEYAHRVPELRPREIGDLGRTFNAMASDLQRAERQRSNLMADMAHELQTPLSNIQGYVEAMKDGVMQRSDETMENVHSQVLHLHHLVEDVKLLSLIDAGALHLNFEDDSIREVLRRSVSSFEAKAQEQDISLRTEIADGIPSIRMDSARLRQVIDNLIGNALRHTPPGGTITVGAEMRSGDEVTVAVSDTGEGIAPELIETVFDRFRRGDPSRARATGGAGLGLAIARNLIEAHGGTIRAESSPGAGATFTFTIQIQSPDAGGASL